MKENSLLQNDRETVFDAHTNNLYHTSLLLNDCSYRTSRLARGQFAPKLGLMFSQ